MLRVALISLFVAAASALFPMQSSSHTPAGESLDRRSSPGIPWSADRPLTWEDFRGAVPVLRGNTAAQTACGFGFSTNSVRPGERVVVTVYNAFRPDRSWVHEEGRTPYVLAHEQAHFDLCEIYTRHLLRRLTQVHLRAENLSQARRIYNEVLEDYQARQDAYDRECGHGLNEGEQARWLRVIEQELQDTEAWASQ